MKVRYVYEDGRIAEREIEPVKAEYGFWAGISSENLPSGIKHVDFLYDYFCANAGDDGYFLVPRGPEDGTVLTYFKERENCERESTFVHLGCYGFCSGKESVIGIVTGMRCSLGLIERVYNGKYELFPRFYLDGDAAEEDIRVEFHKTENTDYSALAGIYREYQLTAGGCTPLSQRAAEDPRLKKASDGISVRIRTAWKPAPSPVLFQNEENEPDVKVGCSFERAGEIADACKRENIENLEFCLVGWNYKGHDGRFPQLFPVEPTLGGETELKKLITKVQGLGYGIVCHDDATQAYPCADCFDEEYLVKTKGATVLAQPQIWSGGQPFKICPQREYERFEIENMKAIRALGFEGIHYVDVLTIVQLPKCYDPHHSSNRTQTAEWYRKIMKLSRKVFGGFSSEAGFDYAAAFTDYVLYTNFKIEKERDLLCDEYIPLFQLVYHGIIMYNPCTYTLNYPVKGAQQRLKFFEWGGRPLAVFNANFADGQHWMGEEDLFNETDEQLKESVRALKMMSDDYEMLKPVRYAYMEKHERLSDGVYETTYSNGIKVRVDYNRKTVDMTGKPTLYVK